MLNDKQIENLCREKGMVSPYAEENLQPHSLDLTLGGSFLFPESKTDLENFSIYSEEDNIWKKYLYDENDPVIGVPPGQFILGTTEEFISLPDDVAAFVLGKSTVGRRGIQIECAGLIDAGFCGQITLELVNFAPYIVKLKVGMPICQIVFHQCEAAASSYAKKGHYMNQVGATAPRI